MHDLLFGYDLIYYDNQMRVSEIHHEYNYAPFVHVVRFQYSVLNLLTAEEHYEKINGQLNFLHRYRFEYLGNLVGEYKNDNDYLEQLYHIDEYGRLAYLEDHSFDPVARKTYSYHSEGNKIQVIGPT